jgi:fructuronate reductase
MQRLSDATIDRIPGAIRRPRYDRAKINTGIVHLGIGAFFRAQQAPYFDDALESGDLAWGILGASLRSPNTRDALAPQDCLYTLMQRGRAGSDFRVIGALGGVLVAPEDPARLSRALADPAVRIVTLTITEKGYCHDPATGKLEEAHADIRHDLKSPQAPRSAIGFVVEALARRRAAGVAPFTLVACDNLPSNGRTLHGLLARFAELRDRELGRFVANEVACPSTMLDRIVPATTAENRAEVARALGLEDAWPVVAEPFSLSVIEDRFPAGRPPFASDEVKLVADVAPWERMKLRLLNGSHSTLAYLGYLAGYETIADTMADADFVALISDLMDEEVTPTLNIPPGADFAGFRRSVPERFANPALKHRCWQIAMDGSQKLPQRLLDTARDRLKAGAAVDRIALAVAAWMRYVTGRDENGAPIDVRDPLSARLRRIADAAGPFAERLAPALLAVEEIFGKDLAAHPRFAAPVTAALEQLFRDGARRTVSQFVARTANSLVH